MIQVYHNPRCSKSRCAIEILEKSGKPFEIVKYLEDIPSKAALKKLVKKLAIQPMQLVRSNEPLWKEKYKAQNLTDDEVIEILSLNPILIERPIVINGNKAVIGRPPENIARII